MHNFGKPILDSKSLMRERHNCSLLCLELLSNRRKKACHQSPLQKLLLSLKFSLNWQKPSNGYGMECKEPLYLQNLEGFWFGSAGRDQKGKEEMMLSVHFYTKNILLALTAKKCSPLLYSLSQATSTTFKMKSSIFPVLSRGNITSLIFPAGY